jgi:hypothetical protein
MVKLAETSNRLAGLCEMPAPTVEVCDIHVTRAPVQFRDDFAGTVLWPRLDLFLFPTSRRVRLISNPNVVAMVKGRVVDGYVVADARNSEWIGQTGGNYIFGLAEQLEAERLFLEGL